MMQADKEVKGFVKLLWTQLIPLNDNPSFQDKFKDDKLTFLVNITDGKYAGLIQIDKGVIQVESVNNGDKKYMKELFKQYDCDGMLETTMATLIEIAQGNLSTRAMLKEILKKNMRVKGIKKLRILSALFDFKMKTLGINSGTLMRDVIKKWAEVYGDSPFLTYVDDFDKGLDEKYSFKDMHTISNQLANGFLAKRINKGDGIALMNINSPEYLFTILAAMKVGAYIVLVNTELKGEGLRYILEHSEASSIIIHWSFLDSFLEIRDQLPKLKKIIVNLRDAPNEFKIPEGAVIINQLMQYQIYLC